MTTAHQPTDLRPPIDEAWLTRMRATKPEFLARLFEVFMTDEPKRMEALGQAIEQGDLDMVRYLAHSLKGAAATLGMERVRDACRELEFAARDQRGDELCPWHQRLAREMDAVYAVIHEAMPQP